MNVKPQGDWSYRVLSTQINDGTCGNIFLQNEMLKRLISLSCIFLFQSIVALLEILLSGHKVSVTLYEFHEVGIIGCLVAFEQQMTVQSKPVADLPTYNKVATQGGCVVVGIDVGGVESLIGQFNTHEVRLECLCPGEVEMTRQCARGFIAVNLGCL